MTTTEQTETPEQGAPAVDTSPAVEFYDIVALSNAAGVDALATALRGVDPSSGPVLDVGAGTGRTVQVVADTLPDARVVAVEPDLAMRAVLMHHVLCDPDLRRRVTVVAEPAQTMPLPDRLSAVVLYGMLGMLDQGERRALWDRLLPRLAPGAPVVVELLPISRPQRIDTLPYANGRVGDTVYTATMDGEPGEGDLMHLTTRWHVVGPGTARTVQSTSRWHTFGLDDLADETGLVAERLTVQAGVLRAAP